MLMTVVMAVTTLAMTLLVPMTMSPAKSIRTHLLQSPIFQSRQYRSNIGFLGEEDLNTTILKLVEGSPSDPPAEDGIHRTSPHEGQRTALPMGMAGTPVWDRLHFIRFSVHECEVGGATKVPAGNTIQSLIIHRRYADFHFSFDSLSDLI